MRILIVEDETSLAIALRDLLTEEGYEADIVGSLFEGIESAMSDAYDCLIVDVELADGSGLDLVQELRSINCLTPIMMLTVHNSPTDRVSGLNVGADDYMGKPFEKSELLARLNALIRRSTFQQGTDVIQYGNVRLDRKSRTLQVDLRILELSSKEYMLLEYFFRHPQQILTRDQLVSHLWGPASDVASNALDTYVYFLRSKCGKLGLHHVIKTIRGQGYTLDPTLIGRH
jgi:DNA-binding response OmpR family regulator